jgi:hypothetical protein
MSQRLLTAALILCLVAAPLGRSAAAAEVGPLVISVPDGFEGPTSSSQDGGVTTAWVKPRPGFAGGTLLQVSMIDLGASLDGLPPAQRGEGARHYLVEFAKAVGRRRQDFELRDIEQVTLAGLPAARVRWTGRLEELSTVGVIYCVLIGHVVVSLQTQDGGSTITPAMYGAISAIEGIRVR